MRPPAEPAPTPAGTPLWTLTAIELARLVRTRAVSPVEVVEAFLQRIELRGDRTNAYVTVAAEQALVAARAAERAVVDVAELPVLHGVPIAVKDLEPVAGLPMSSGVGALRSYVPPRDAPSVARLKAAGAIVLGKTNTPELGHKGVTDSPAFGPASTPFAAGMNAGGSSGGSAAAVADALAPVATGGDGGGSIRIPAAMCGVYGLKPSWGRIPLGIAPNAYLSAPFVCLGPLARTVADAALLTQIMSGPHADEPFCLPPADLGLVDAAASASVAGMRIAYSADLDVFPVEPEVHELVEQAVAALAAAGAEVEQVALGLERSGAELVDVLVAEVAVVKANEIAHWQAEGVDLLDPAVGLSPELVESVERGRRMSAQEYDALGVAKTEVLHAFEHVLGRFDALLSPTVAVSGVRNGVEGRTLGPHIVAGQAVNPLVGWCLTYLCNMTGHPAASAPAGLTEAGLPVGLQIIGPRWREDIVVTVSAALERERPWHDAYPFRRCG